MLCDEGRYLQTLPYYRTPESEKPQKSRKAQAVPSAGEGEGNFVTSLEEETYVMLAAGGGGSRPADVLAEEAERQLLRGLRLRASAYSGRPGFATRSVTRVSLRWKIA
jgi:hypothetical protein